MLKHGLYNFEVHFKMWVASTNVDEFDEILTSEIDFGFVYAVDSNLQSFVKSLPAIGRSDFYRVFHRQHRKVRRTFSNLDVWQY